MRYFALLLVAVIVFGLIGYASWNFKRTWNYTWSYETRVQETVCEMVKPEYLKDPSKC